MKIAVPYGRSTVRAEVADGVPVDVIDLPEVEAAADPTGAVAAALDEPLGGFDWSQLGAVGSVAIAVNDKTRPVPHEHLLPPLLARLAAAGIADEAITFYVAVGAHPPMRPSEFDSVLPASISNRYWVLSHDAEDEHGLVDLGATSRGTPVQVNHGFAEADLKIVVGTIEPHQFVGFSGGVKTAAIGLAGHATIDANHTLMTHPDSEVATYAGNPARQDVEEIGRMIGIDLAVNAILDRRRAIVTALAGEPVAVMEAGVPLARRHGQVTVGHRYAVVVSSPGGHPKDINVYQAQKAVAAAARIVRPGGTIVLVAACPEGSGSTSYEDWVARKHSREEVAETFAREGFRLGPHKAYQLARDTEHARLLVCSDMPDELARTLLLDQAPDLQAALDVALAGVAPGGRVAVLPHASTTVPYVADGMGPTSRESDTSRVSGRSADR